MQGSLTVQLRAEKCLIQTPPLSNTNSSRSPQLLTAGKPFFPKTDPENVGSRYEQNAVKATMPPPLWTRVEGPGASYTCSGYCTHVHIHHYNCVDALQDLVSLEESWEQVHVCSAGVERAVNLAAPQGETSIKPLTEPWVDPLTTSHNQEGLVILGKGSCKGKGMTTEEMLPPIPAKAGTGLHCAHRSFCTIHLLRLHRPTRS